MYCSHCGKYIPNGLDACRACKTKVIDTDYVRKLETAMKTLYAKTQEQSLTIDNQKAELDELKCEKEVFTLTAGTYKGGRDLPVGRYNIRLVSGECLLKTTKTGRNSLNLGEIDSYNGFEVTRDTVLSFSTPAVVEMTFLDGKSYVDRIEERITLSTQWQLDKTKKELDEREKKIKEQEQKNNDEINLIAEEMRIITSDVVDAYYVFSDYESISSQECKDEISLRQSQEKNLRRNGQDVKGNDDREIRKILRSFNAECDNILLNLRQKNVDVCRNKIQKSYESLNKLYEHDEVQLTDSLLKLKLDQLTYLYTYELKRQQEAEIQRAIKEQMMDEAKAEREIQAEKKRIEKDLHQHQQEVHRMMKYLQKVTIDAEKEVYLDKIKELEDKIAALEGDHAEVLKREQAKAGFVYVISNIGSFGDDVFKIGMTRRLEPMDRIHELSSASVPFEFDVHAMIFSSDAPNLESKLHRRFADKRVNKVNYRKEFFHATIDEIERVVTEEFDNSVQFTKIPLATEYRQSYES